VTVGENACEVPQLVLPTSQLFISRNLQEATLYSSNPIFQFTKSIQLSTRNPNTANMLRTFTRNTVSKTLFKPSMAAPLRTRGMADKKIEDLSQTAGEAKDTNPKNPSVISSGGAVGKQFNPDGNIGQVGEAVSLHTTATSLMQRLMNLR
jgi:uncharacterized protein with von Willebrand factor type A (vWA) domain